MKGHPIRYSADETAWLETNRLLPIGDYARAFRETFGRDVDAANLHALRKRKGWKTGRTGQFDKGAVPVNKGTTCPPGFGGRHPNAQRTQFRKGGRTGRAQKNYQPIGAERTSKDGYRERKVHDGLPLQSRWRAVHLIEWEAVNGPIPAGHCLKSRDGNRANADPANWQAIPRALLPRLNGGRTKTHLAYDEAHPDIRPALLTIAKVAHKARELRKRRSA